MSDSLYLQRRKVAFLVAHPKDDGWLTYEFSQRLQRELSMGSLLDFLRDRHPDIVRRHSTMDEVRTPDMLGEKGDSHQVEPGSEWDKRKLDAYNWTGILELEWQGQPIHYEAVRILSEHGGHFDRVFAAAQSNSAFRSLQAALIAYEEERVRARGRWIEVTNGEDIRVPNVSWEDVLLPGALRDEISSGVAAFFDEKTRAKYQELGISYRRGFIFAGPPGCGKTQTLRAVANAVKASVVALHATAKLSDEDLDHAFGRAKRLAPCVLMIEDLDRVVRSRDVGISFLLNLLDGLKVSEGVLVIATSNHPEVLDPALLHRPSRFDRIWRFPLPALEQRRALLERKGGKFFSPATLDDAAKASNGFSMAYVQEIVVNAMLECLGDGGIPTDKHLADSVQELKGQRKAASKVEEGRLEVEAMGFVGGGESMPRGPEAMLRGLEEEEEGEEEQ